MTSEDIKQQLNNHNPDSQATTGEVITHTSLKENSAKASWLIISVENVQILSSACSGFWNQMVQSNSPQDISLQDN